MRYRSWLSLAACGATVAAVLAAAGPASADDNLIRVSCVRGGSIVHREDLPANAPSNMRLQIAAAYPKALCAFLKVGPAPPASALPPQLDAALKASAPDGLPAGPVTGNEDLAKALSFLSSNGGNAPVGTPYDTAAPQAATGPAIGQDAFASQDGVFTNTQETVNLTIGVYQDTSSEDILAHWNYIKENTKILARMTPLLQSAGDVTVLNVEDVPDSDAEEACREADKVASGCIAVY